MTNPFQTPTAQNFGLLLGRVTLGFYFAVEGYRTVMNDPTGPAKTFANTFPNWVPEVLQRVYLYQVPFVELFFGLLLAAGFLPRLSAGLLGCVLIFMIAVKGVLAGNDNLQPLVIFLALATILTTTGGGNMTLPALFGKKGAAGSAPKPAPAK